MHWSTPMLVDAPCAIFFFSSVNFLRQCMHILLSAQANSSQDEEVLWFYLYRVLYWTATFWSPGPNLCKRPCNMHHAYQRSFLLLGSSDSIRKVHCRQGTVPAPFLAGIPHPHSVLRVKKQTAKGALFWKDKLLALDGPLYPTQGLSQHPSEAKKALDKSQASSTSPPPFITNATIFEVNIWFEITCKEGKRNFLGDRCSLLEVNQILQLWLGSCKTVATRDCGGEQVGSFCCQLPSKARNLTQQSTSEAGYVFVPAVL